MSSAWMIYGANGYTGELVAREAIRRGLSPVLAGRNSGAVTKLARELGLESRVFGLASERELASGLQGISVVLHCAGPFSSTAQPMLNGCLKAKAHYLDITGEISVFEGVLNRSGECAKAGITAIPGVGFDVVPSDCLAATLKKRLPDAISLTLAMKPRGRFSRGTLKTMVEGLGAGGAVRRGGKIVPVPPAYRQRQIQFDQGPELAVTIPWGDISTAFHSTGIPEIEFYLRTKPSAVRFLRALKAMKRFTSRRSVQLLLQKLIGLTVTGPSAEERRTGSCVFWGEVRNASGKSVEARLFGPEGYSLTVDSSLLAVSRLLAGGIAVGALTPSRAFGEGFAAELNGVTLN